MKTDNLILGQEVYIYIDGLYPTFNTNAILKGNIISLLPDSIMVKCGNNHRYTFERKNNWITNSFKNPKIKYILFNSEEDILRRNESINMLESLSLLFQRPHSMSEIHDDDEDSIRVLYNTFFADKPKPLTWKQKQCGFSAVEQTDSYVATYAIEESNGEWLVCASLASCLTETYHGREYEMSSREKSIIDARKQIEVFRNFMIARVIDDLRHL